jgi:hypothetical protein
MNVFDSITLDCNNIKKVSQNSIQTIIPGENPILLINYGVKNSIVRQLEALSIPFVTSPPRIREVRPLATTAAKSKYPIISFGVNSASLSLMARRLFQESYERSKEKSDSLSAQLSIDFSNRIQRRRSHRHRQYQNPNGMTPMLVATAIQPVKTSALIDQRPRSSFLVEDYGRVSWFQSIRVHILRSAQRSNLDSLELLSLSASNRLFSLFENLIPCQCGLASANGRGRHLLS